MRVLGLETSCDDTAAAVVENGRLRSSVFASQTEVHRRFGGVVPELASRSHLETLPATIEAALAGADLRMGDLDAVAATYGPGLIGALMVGVCAGKALAFALGKPFLGTNHLQAHVAAALLEAPDLEPPFLGLVVSGGHTLLVHVRAWDAFVLLGRTVDDAAGEVLDKIARLMGLGYPGGKAIEERARAGRVGAVKLPRPSTTRPLDFSFAGLKTAAARAWQRSAEDSLSVENLSAALQDALVGALGERLEAAIACTGLRTVVLAGGVAANASLRARCRSIAQAHGARFIVPAPALCTDNAAMVACLAERRLLAAGRGGAGVATEKEAGETATGASGLDLGPDPALSIETP